MEHIRYALIDLLVEFDHPKQLSWRFLLLIEFFELNLDRILVEPIILHLHRGISHVLLRQLPKLLKPEVQVLQRAREITNLLLVKVELLLYFNHLVRKVIVWLGYHPYLLQTLHVETH